MSLSLALKYYSTSSAEQKTLKKQKHPLETAHSLLLLHKQVFKCATEFLVAVPNSELCYLYQDARKSKPKMLL